MTIEHVGIVFLGVIMLALATRDFVDNHALQKCAKQLERIADAVSTAPSPGRTDAALGMVVPELKRIADILDRKEMSETGRY